MTKRTLGYSYPIALTISLVPALTPAIVQAAPLTPPPATGILDGLCYDYVPKIEKLAPGKDANAQPVEVDADRLEAKQGGTAVYQGDVKVRQGVRKFDSDYAELDQKSRDVIAIGNIYYNDGQITVTSDKTLKSNLDTKNSELEEGKYQVHGSPVRGSADRVTMTNNNQNITLEGAQYTTCPPGQEVWTLKAGSIDIDQTEVFGEAWNASLWLYDYPVFYFPYINFPIKDERKTGLLYPGYTQSSKNGMDITQPFYWNIAPNYDATITSRFMDRRGLMEQVQFRYMPDPAHVGSLYFENLANDKQYDETPSLNQAMSDGHRYLLNANHTSLFADNAMRVSLDYTKVRDRDYNYFNDFSPKVGTQVENQLQQSLMAGYFQPNWNINTEVRTYQILLASAQQPHELMPRIDHNYYQQGSWYDLAWNTEITKFGYNNAQAIAQNQGGAYTGTRVYTAPTLTMPLINEAGYYLDSQYKLMYTRYDQEVPDNMSQTFVSRFTPENGNGVTLDEGIITRTLPSFRLKGGMTFERNQNWFGGDANQTLEPEFQYLYVPYKNQDNIGVYDSTSMRQDYYSLFSDRRYAGLDRISDSNRVSIGLTSRVYDEAGDERIRLAVAQAFDFVAPRVKLYPSETLTTNTRSPLSFEGDAKINEQWFAHAGAQYDVDQSRLSSANSALEYRREKLISQLNHRFVRDANYDLENKGQVTDLNQIGLLLTTPLNDQWHLYGGYYQELNQSVKSDRKVGLKYDSCCWSINFNLEWVNTPDNVTMRPTSERSLGIQFEMKGLGSVGTGSKGTSLDTEALPYIRPFNLRDQ
ncbi:LPS assembly protein LptD [Aeromonas hydrophila]|uniref:LPS-assembly protein LptD n=1 Tax=Aeromonas hydrophila subsp. hydrophila (strain ATCC 7966 / DSM 30187 / BCRC 13018 / CCUG 14551 / JCM 1027 / KCTC 2358 / NCIMB 9240 / NCTC 8049) TaxID=380703 RepID=LPTD_AERHH|nr:LPS assembly protein LptD [Aeromonas hydrophila]A0KGU1.1 RecName: Full=LPS-assembly protein LptD; Flags: Precursor [Aeromonas hydrophila subsp. hydrophila ATCC 7966]ABK37719.1 organic solvent tolerance protein [Aeromonas hydrophila subsp. hydrophila ATCC 7966]MBS4670157.1 LPS assembly protein LptD [Aeromonas hydrophila]OOD33146.1 LPS biosynthesis protein [Aeromonas hydrophila]SUU20475.1 organic solvent tolerance protein [Aeromonas hydrophila]